MKNGQQQGPVTAELLSGLIAPSDLVWKKGLSEWVPANTIPNLLATRGGQPPATPVPPPPGVLDKIMPSNPPKDPILMAVVSFFIPWLGQILIGQVAKGIVMILMTPILVVLFVIVTLGMGLIVLPFISLVAVIDAYLLAKKLKEGQAIGNWEFFGIESATRLAMPDLLPTARDQGGKPVAVVKPRPPGLVGSAIGILFVSGLAMAISLLGVFAIIADSVSTGIQLLIALSFVHNAWVIFAIFQMMKMQRYAFAITAPLLVMGSWLWLSFSGVPIGLTLMGILGGISVGVWSLGVLRQPEVRAAFANQYDPLETLLPMAKATIQGQSPNLEAIKGLLRQLLGSKIALGIAGVVVLILLVVPLFSLLGRSKNSSNFRSREESGFGQSKSKTSWGDEEDKENPSEFGPSKNESPSGKSGGKKKRPQGSNAYQEGYHIGHDAAKALVELSRATNTPLDRAELTRQADEFQRTCAAIQSVSKGGQEERDMVRGYYDGMKAALGE
jgi:TM2 domain-containing membrane protein YozV